MEKAPVAMNISILKTMQQVRLGSVGKMRDDNITHPLIDPLDVGSSEIDRARYTEDWTQEYKQDPNAKPRPRPTTPPPTAAPTARSRACHQGTGNIVITTLGLFLLCKASVRQ